LVGGEGDDRFEVNAGDTLLELADGGTDTVVSYIDWTLADNVENLTIAYDGWATNPISGTGNALANTITGSEIANVLNGGAGDDTLAGANGADTLFGGDGNDLLDADFLYLDYDVSGDSLLGGAGDDIYQLTNSQDVVVEAPGEGIDTVRAYQSWTLGANIENLECAGQGTGNELDNQITGRTTHDLLIGLAGNDTLDGGVNSSDTLIGGTGNDTYYSNGGDVLTELANEGTDTVMSVTNFTLGTNFENLVLIGYSSVDGMGNAYANRMTGNIKNNVLNGAAGDDTISGDAGTDALYGGSGADAFVFDTTLGAANIDTIYDFEAGVERIWLDDDIFGQFSAALSSSLDSGSFHAAAGAVAQDADDRILYDSATGALYYDADGSGSGLAVQFAIVGSGAHPDLTAADFLIVD
jgi:serralysin